MYVTMELSANLKHHVSPWRIAPKRDYTPCEFTHDVVNGAAWADHDFAEEMVEDLKRHRLTYEGPIEFDKASGRPLNPRGRTGLTGRGSLGRWGPNHAIDVIVTRHHPVTRKLQVVLVKRGDVVAEERNHMRRLSRRSRTVSFSSGHTESNVVKSLQQGSRAKRTPPHTRERGDSSPEVVAMSSLVHQDSPSTPELSFSRRRRASDSSCSSEERAKSRWRVAMDGVIASHRLRNPRLKPPAGAVTRADVGRQVRILPMTGSKSLLRIDDEDRAEIAHSFSSERVGKIRSAHPRLWGTVEIEFADTTVSVQNPPVPDSMDAWAFPGRLVEMDDLKTLPSAATKTNNRRVHASLMKEVLHTFITEAFDHSQDSGVTRREAARVRRRIVNELDDGFVLYCGYVEDPRSTDNAWVETTAVHVHCPVGLGAEIALSQRADEDGASKAAQVTDCVWADVDALQSYLQVSGHQLYASHSAWLDRVVQRINATEKSLPRMLVGWGRKDIAEKALSNPDLRVMRNPVLHIQPAFQEALQRATRGTAQLFNVELVDMLMSHGARVSACDLRFLFDDPNARDPFLLHHEMQVCPIAYLPIQPAQRTGHVVQPPQDSLFCLCFPLRCSSHLCVPTCTVSDRRWSSNGFAAIGCSLSGRMRRWTTR